jgi:hypothetical protein
LQLRHPVDGAPLHFEEEVPEDLRSWLQLGSEAGP